MGPVGAAAAARQTRRAAPGSELARGPQWDLLLPQRRWWLALLAARSASLGHGALVLSSLAARWHLETRPRRLALPGPGSGGPGSPADRRDPRQPERQDHQKGGPRGYDAGKKVHGRKRHLLVDVLGLILVLVVHPADVQDPEGAKQVL